MRDDLRGIIALTALTFHEARQRKVLLLAYGAAFQLRPLLVCYLLMWAFQASFLAIPPVPAVLAWGSVVVACSNVPYLQWGTGARESALIAFFSSFVAPGLAGEVLIAIGILMAVAIHVVPAVIGLPVLGSFLGTLETGREPAEFTEASEANAPEAGR